MDILTEKLKALDIIGNYNAVDLLHCVIENKKSSFMITEEVIEKLKQESLDENTISYLESYLNHNLSNKEFMVQINQLNISRKYKDLILKHSKRELKMHEKLHNWVTLGCLVDSDIFFDSFKDLNDNKKIERIKINEDINILICHQIVSFKCLEDILKESNNNFFSNVDEEKTTKIDKYKLHNKFEGLLLPLNYPVLCFEYFDIGKKIIHELKQEEITQVNKIILDKTVGIVNLTKFFDRVGNIFFFAPDRRFKIDVTESRTDNTLFVECLYHPSIKDLKDYTLNILIQDADELIKSLSITDIKDFQNFPDFANQGEIFIELWEKNGSLILKERHRFITQINLSMNIITKQRIITDGKNTRKVSISDKTRDIKVGESTSDWRSNVLERKLEIKKQSLIESKEMIHLTNNYSHQDAIKEIIGIINSCKNRIKIWEPYASTDDLKKILLDFGQSDIPIQVINDSQSLSVSIKDEISEEDFNNLVLSKIQNSDKDLILKYFKKDSANKYIRESISSLKAQLKQGLINEFIIDQTFLDEQILVDEILKRVSYEKIDRYKIKMQRDLEELKNAWLNIEIRFNYQTPGFAFHDRFIITEGKAWSIGSSINHLGEKHSLILQVGYPELIEREFDRFWSALAVNSICA